MTPQRGNNSRQKRGTPPTSERGSLASALEKAGVVSKEGEHSTKGPTKNSLGRQEDAESAVNIGSCIVCGAPVFGGWYGRHGDKGTCNKQCETTQSQRPRYPVNN